MHVAWDLIHITLGLGILRIENCKMKFIICYVLALEEGHRRALFLIALAMPREGSRGFQPTGWTCFGAARRGATVEGEGVIRFPWVGVRRRRSGTRDNSGAPTPGG